MSRKGSKDVVDHMAIHMDDSDSITVSEQSEPSAECWQNMYKLLNFYSLISDPTGILEKSSETFGPAGNGRFYGFKTSVLNCSNTGLFIMASSCRKCIIEMRSWQ